MVRTVPEQVHRDVLVALTLALLLASETVRSQAGPSVGVGSTVVMSLDPQAAAVASTTRKMMGRARIDYL